MLHRATVPALKSYNLDALIGVSVSVQHQLQHSLLPCAGRAMCLQQQVAATDASMVCCHVPLCQLQECCCDQR